MSDSKIFIPQLWEDKGNPQINVKEVTVKIITSNKNNIILPFLRQPMLSRKLHTTESSKLLILH